MNSLYIFLEPLYCLAGVGLVQWLAQRTRRLPDSVFRQAFWDYWPSILRALVLQVLGIVAGILLVFFDNSGGHSFLFAGFASWLLVYLLVLERPHPGALEKAFVSVLPAVVFAACILVDWHRAA